MFKGTTGAQVKWRIAAACQCGIHVAQMILGSGRVILLVGNSVNVLASEATTGFLRVRPPGLTLTYVMASFSLCALLWGPKRGRRFMLVVCSASLLSVALSLNRNMMMALPLALLATGVITQHLRRVVFVVLGGFALLSILLLVVGGDVRSVSPATVVAARVGTIADYRFLQETSLNDRYRETGAALHTLARSPLLGVGWGVPYGAPFDVVYGGVSVTEQRQWIHNEYVGLWLRAGLIGLLALVALLLVLIRRGSVWASERGSRDDAWMGAGLVCSTLTLVLSSFVGMYLSTGDSLMVFAFLVALAWSFRPAANAVVVTPSALQDE